MTHHPPLLGAPVAPVDPGRHRRPIIVIRLSLVLAAALVTVACSGDGTTGSLDGALDEADRATGEIGDDGSMELSFGDPADVGFDGVEDTEVEPVAPTDGEPVDLVDEVPDEVIEDVADELGPVDGTEEILDAIEPVDRIDDDAADPDGRPRNELGELVELDDEASLACAQTEIAIGLLDDGLPGIAIERILSGAERAEASSVDDVRAWAEPLREVTAGGDVSDPAPLVGFLTVCTKGGYEL